MRAPPAFDSPQPFLKAPRVGHHAMGGEPVVGRYQRVDVRRPSNSNGTPRLLTHRISIDQIRARARE